MIQTMYSTWMWPDKPTIATTVVNSIKSSFKTNAWKLNWVINITETFDSPLLRETAVWYSTVVFACKCEEGLHDVSIMSFFACGCTTPRAWGCMHVLTVYARVCMWGHFCGVGARWYCPPTVTCFGTCWLALLSLCLFCFSGTFIQWCTWPRRC